MQQARNNFKSLVLLCLFPCLVLILTMLACMLFVYFTPSGEELTFNYVWEQSLYMFISAAPFVLIGVLVWFLIAYFANTAIIQAATGSQPLERKDNKRVYNLVENLCMSQGMPMPKVNVIEDNSLNAFASGISKSTYTVSLSRGIINRLNDDELEGVIAHELMHIRNRDVRLLIVSIVFVGIFAMVAQMAFRAMLYSGGGRNRDGRTAAVMMLIAFLVAILGYFFATLMRFAISRKREYMADAGAAEMTRQPQALASALRKISHDPKIEAITRSDVAQLFIEHPLKGKGFSSLFATHPPIKKRIAILEQV